MQFKPAPDPAYQAAKEENLRKLHAKLKAGEGISPPPRSSTPKGFNAEHGGVMGWKDAADLRAEILDSVKGLPEGRIGDPLKLGDDTFLVKVLGRRPAGLRPLADVMPEIESELFEARAKEAYKAWLVRLRHKFPVTVY
ncbi:MAG: peptidylprolyl isomerase [Kiritimatiellia bacterium]